LAAPHLARSVPLKKGLDDAMIALYQNGERLMPRRRLWRNIM
jgi:sulfane dehydrogenase subunit SoxC